MSPENHSKTDSISENHFLGSMPKDKDNSDPDQIKISPLLLNRFAQFKKASPKQAYKTNSHATSVENLYKKENNDYIKKEFSKFTCLDNKYKFRKDVDLNHLFNTRMFNYVLNH